MTGVLVALVLMALQPRLAAQAPAGEAQAPVLASQGYAVGPEDVLKITVFDEADLSKNYRIDTDGMINFPYLGAVPVQGRTVKQIADELTRLLEKGYLRHPQVTVEVEQYRSRTIFVLGEVKEPGMYSITGEVGLLEALTKAGSFTPNAGDDIRLSRLTDQSKPASQADPSSYDTVVISREGLLNGTAGQNVLMQDSDRVVVTEAKKFYIMGQVRSPGYYSVYKNMTIQQAIAVAGGLGERGSDRRLKVRRRDAKGQIKELSAKKTDLVQADDTIVVGARIF